MKKPLRARHLFHEKCKGSYVRVPVQVQEAWQIAEYMYIEKRAAGKDNVFTGCN